MDDDCWQGYKQNHFPRIIDALHEISTEKIIEKIDLIKTDVNKEVSNITKKIYSFQTDINQDISIIKNQLETIEASQGETLEKLSVLILDMKKISENQELVSTEISRIQDQIEEFIAFGKKIQNWFYVVIGLVIVVGILVVTLN